MNVHVPASAVAQTVPLGAKAANLLVATNLRRRALATPLNEDPHLLHGVLLMLEHRVTADTLGRLVGVEPWQVLRTATAARNGDLPQARAWMGDRMPSELGARRIKSRELFTTPWYRKAVELMLRPQGALSTELYEVTVEFGLSGAPQHLIKRLKAKIEDEGFDVIVEANARGNQALYRIAARHVDRLIEIIGNGWMA